MKLCPQCEFIYEDDQRFCDMDGQELVHDPSPRAFAESAPVSPAPIQNDHVTRSVIQIPIPIPGSSPVALPAAGVAASVPSRWQPRGLAVAAVAGLILVALLFVVYYARTHQSQTRKANRSSAAASQYDSQSNAQTATQSADMQSAAPVSSESVTPNGDTASEQALEQSPSASSNEASSAGRTSPASESLPSLATGSEKSARVRQNSTLVAAGASSDTGRAPVVIRLNNGASIKADEAWEKREGVWYRQAGMVTFLKRSRVKSIQRPTYAARSQTIQTGPKAEKSIALNQPRVGKPQTVSAKKDSKVTSFLKKTGRILKKPFRL